MNRDYLPPLHRGIGTLVAYLEARNDVEQHRLLMPTPLLSPASDYPSQPALHLVAKELRELRSEAQDDNFAEDVIQNRWFGWLGLIGAGIASSSFYVESFLRRSKSASGKGSTDKAI